jgi:hypothetical protein
MSSISHAITVIAQTYPGDGAVDQLNTDADTAMKKLVFLGLAVGGVLTLVGLIFSAKLRKIGVLCMAGSIAMAVVAGGLGKQIVDYAFLLGSK